MDELRADGSLRLPELHLDIHVYSEKPAERFVFINMGKYKEGDRLAEGPAVREIRPDGVVLDQGGTRFLMPRQ
jgi:general secretion pathway protein B